MTTTKQAIIAQADRDHAAHAQYRGHWNGPEWYLVTIRRDIRTKMGVAFCKGDVTIARADRGDDAAFVTAYSFRNKIDTSIRARDVRPVEGSAL